MAQKEGEERPTATVFSGEGWAVRINTTVLFVEDTESGVTLQIIHNRSDGGMLFITEGRVEPIPLSGNKIGWNVVPR